MSELTILAPTQRALTINPEKYSEEIKFWTEELDRYVRWYNGEWPEFYGVLPPTADQKINRHADPRMNAFETWINCDRWRYAKHLFVEPTYFMNKVLLEVGCGPMGLAQWFAGALVIGVDPLVSVYRDVGYPIDNQNIGYVENFAEDMHEIGDATIEAVISVNAIDHVDDFEKAVAEIERVLKPDGDVRIEVHYHAPTATEPLVLDDWRVADAFKKFPVRKINEVPFSHFYPKGYCPENDRLALWSNHDHLFRADRALK